MFVTVLVLVAVYTKTAYCDFCPSGNSGQIINWEKLSEANKYWYDVIVIPQPASVIDCWDMRNIAPSEDGFTVELVEYSEGGDMTRAVQTHWILNTDGSYTWDVQDKERLNNSTKLTLAHKLDQKVIEIIDRTTDKLFSLTWWFMTDYEHYFISGACLSDTGKEYVGFIKFNRQRPPLRDVLNVWNRFSELKESPLVHAKHICTNRRRATHK